MRWSIPVALIALVTLAPAAWAGPVSIGGQLIYGDDTDLGIGARVEVDTPELAERTRVAMDFNWYFPDDPPGGDFTFWEIDGNFLYDVATTGTDTQIGVYVGGGLNFAYASFDPDVGDGDSEKDLGVNLVGGVEIPIGLATMIGEMRVTIAGSEQYTLGVGLLF